VDPSGANVFEQQAHDGESGNVHALAGSRIGPTRPRRGAVGHGGDRDGRRPAVVIRPVAKWKVDPASSRFQIKGGRIGHADSQIAAFDARPPPVDDSRSVIPARDSCGRQISSGNAPALAADRFEGTFQFGEEIRMVVFRDAGGPEIGPFPPSGPWIQKRPPIGLGRACRRPRPHTLASPRSGTSSEGLPSLADKVFAVSPAHGLRAGI